MAVRHRLIGMAAMAAVAVLAAPTPGAAGQAPAAERLTLRAAIREALRRSPELAAPEEAMAAARSGLAQAESRFGTRLTPSFAGGSPMLGVVQQTMGLGVSRQLKTGTLVSVDASWYRYATQGLPLADRGFTVMVSQPLLSAFSGATTAELRSAERGVESAARMHEQARRDLVVRVAEAYFAVVREQRLLEAVGKAVERAAHLHEASGARARVGFATRLDVLRADLLLAQARSAELDAAEALENASDRLKVVIGRDVSHPVEVEAADALSFARAMGEDSRTSDAAIRAAVAMHPSYLAARSRVEQSELEMKLARWRMAPPLNLNVGYTRRSLDGAGSSLLTPASGWTIGFSTAYGMDGASSRAAAALAAGAVRAAERHAAQVEARLVADLRRADRQWRRLAASLDLNRRTQAIAGEQRDLARLRFERGLADNADVIEAEEAWLRGEAAAVAAELEAALARLERERSLGRLNPDEYLP